MTQVALVTGGLGDIGRATAQRLVQNGYKVAVADLKLGTVPGARLNVLDITQLELVAQWIGWLKRGGALQPPWCQTRAMNVTNGWYGCLAASRLYDEDVYSVWQSPFAAGGLETVIVELTKNRD